MDVDWWNVRGCNARSKSLRSGSNPASSSASSEISDSADPLTVLVVLGVVGRLQVFNVCCKIPSSLGLSRLTHNMREELGIWDAEAIVSMEMDYVKDLQLIVELFYSSLMDTLREVSTSVPFPNIEDILHSSTAFLSTSGGATACIRTLRRPGYCINQANAGKVLQPLRDTNQELSAQLRCLWEDPSARNLDLSSSLLAPHQSTRTNARPVFGTTIDISLPTAHAELEPIGYALAYAEHILEEVNETI
ncbi:hypothetical protein BKA82DRAFT_32571 [Pisolithus tinctorius]|uniref:DH domain-containing protein n=1 Tax=Pisolithus tinctorius Marx 270 TaxID=870435 RepID=A0A0C3IJD8_PISTI|nr:hypothetical protein BKA82DRAFT_32571 [Pisolithus tinctorius]KIN97107.1 hypothetical protein M404DRAFT_32571 [Pisolithus tinctorius Marx 270]